MGDIIIEVLEEKKVKLEKQLAKIEEKLDANYTEEYFELTKGIQNLYNEKKFNEAAILIGKQNVLYNKIMNQTKNWQKLFDKSIQLKIKINELSSEIESKKYRNMLRYGC